MASDGEIFPLRPSASTSEPSYRIAPTTRASDPELVECTAFLVRAIMMRQHDCACASAFGVSCFARSVKAGTSVLRIRDAPSDGHTYRRRNLQICLELTYLYTQRMEDAAIAPTAEFQLEFLTKVERILSQGQSTTTYKFALLIALTNIAVEQGADSGDALEVRLDDIARQYLDLYWNMARPFPRVGAILKQSTNNAKPAKIITLLAREARHSQSSYQRLRAYRATRDSLITETRRTLARDVLYRLQTVGTNKESQTDRFLYEHPPTAADCAKLERLTLKPGVAACLRRLRGVIIAMVEARWALWVREKNDSLATDRELEQFLFGATRTNVAVYAERFYDLQGGRCFYTSKKLDDPKSGEVDHFIPWARYPFDSPFNLVLASKAANNKLRDDLKPPEWREKWLERNNMHFLRLIAPAHDGFAALREDRETVRAIAAWVYARG